MSIRRKLTMTMVGISLAAVTLTVLPITAYLIYDIRLAKEQELAVTATITADRNSASLIFLDNARAESNLEVFRVNPAILAACIYNSAGVLFANYIPDKGGIPCPASKNDMPRQSDMLTHWQEMDQNGEHIGSIFMAENTSDIDAYVRKILLIAGTVSVAVLFITSLLALRFQRGITGPILALAHTAEEITANHDYTLEAPKGLKDEPGKLAAAFDSMIGEVRKRDNALQRANETLEIKVVERTRELEEAKSRAEAANAAKSEFLRNMSHEFRTPLHALISFSAYGINEYATAQRDQLKEYFAIIEKGAARLSRLVNEVLDLARVEHGELRLLLSRADLLDLSGRAIELVRPLMEEKHIQLRISGGGQPVFAMCDNDKIVQVLTNLLGNAIKFTPENAAIQLSLESYAQDGASYASICVSDAGVGIPEGEEELIFESFRQSSRTNTGAGGTGLGLAICRGIVECHGGRIWAFNNVGRPGASVTFTLPVLPAASGDPGARKQGVAA